MLCVWICGLSEHLCSCSSQGKQLSDARPSLVSAHNPLHETLHVHHITCRGPFGPGVKCAVYMYMYMNNQVHRALFRKEGEGKERERKKITTTSMA